MIVVAIIGILASVAIPNFQRFQRKARQSEASSLLAAYHSAQKATYSEWSFYPGNFSASGFNPDGQLTYRITAANNITGFTAAPGLQPIVGYSATCLTTAGAVCPANYQAWAERTVGVANGLAGPAAAVGCVNSAHIATVLTAGTAGPRADGESFIACASAFLGGATADTWSINETKIVLNNNSGI